MKNYLRSLDYCFVIIGGIFFLYSSAFSQENLFDKNNHRGKIFHQTPQMILEPGRCFRATALNDNSRIVFLVCDKKEDCGKLKKEFTHGRRYELKKLDKNDDGTLEACLGNMSLE